MTTNICDVCKKQLAMTCINLYKGIEIRSFSHTILNKKLDLCDDCYYKIKDFIYKLETDNEDEL